MRRFALLFFVAGCYAPTINDGDFTCATYNLCPQGFTCIDGLCRTPGSTNDLRGFGGDLGGVDLAGDMESGPRSFVGSGLLGVVDLTGQSGTLLVNTESGLMKLGTTTIVAAGVPGFTHASQTNGPPVGIWSFDTLVIPSTVNVQPDSASASVPVFLGKTSLHIVGDIDWRGFGGFGGLANMPGGTRNNPSGIGVGTAGTSDGGGGGGGGYAAVGNPGTGPGNGSGGSIYGTSDIMPVYFGAGGGGGGGSSAGRGGAGGGAIVLIGTDVVISAKIDVSGNDGSAANGTNVLGGGGGGGSGGSILIGGDSVALQAGHQLIALGGDGNTGEEGPGGIDAGLVAGGNGGTGAAGRVRITTSSQSGAANSQPAASTDTRLITHFP